MFRLLIVGGIGYVLGARAGRERYEQLLEFTKNFRENALVVEALSAARKQLGGDEPFAGDR